MCSVDDEGRQLERVRRRSVKSENVCASHTVIRSAASALAGIPATAGAAARAATFSTWRAADHRHGALGDRPRVVDGVRAAYRRLTDQLSTSVHTAHTAHAVRLVVRMPEVTGDEPRVIDVARLLHNAHRQR